MVVCFLKNNFLFFKWPSHSGHILPRKTLCVHAPLWFAASSHLISFNQSECFISVWHSYGSLKYVYDISSGILNQEVTGLSTVPQLLPRDLKNTFIIFNKFFQAWRQNLKDSPSGPNQFLSRSAHSDFVDFTPNFCWQFNFQILWFKFRVIRKSFPKIFPTILG